MTNFDNELSHKQIQNSLLEILTSFDSFCNENGLEYFLSGGTLLGAIRHDGFIPWDDDVDVMMPRPDYDKLFLLTPNGWFDNRYRLVSYTNGLALIPFAKIIDTNIQLKQEFTNSDDYLWIDIFPLDAVPQDVNKCNRLLTKMHRLKYLASLSLSPLGKGSTKFRALFKLPFLFLIKIQLEVFGKDLYIKRIVKESNRIPYEDSPYIAALMWCCGPQERMKKSELYPRVKHDFCNVQMYIASNWDSYLTNMLGDYWKLPPVKERKGHSYQAFYAKKIEE